MVFLMSLSLTEDYHKHLNKAAIAVGADGLLIEMHPEPSLAWSDADQALSPLELHNLMMALDPLAKSVGRSIIINN